MFRSSLPNWKRVYFRGWHTVPINQKPTTTLVDLGGEAVRGALGKSGVESGEVGAFYVGNMLSARLDYQHQLSAFLARKVGLEHTDLETLTLDAACGSGGAALRAGYFSILSGKVKHALVLGIERMEGPRDDITKGLAGASDWEREGKKGETFVTLNGHLHNLYMEKYGVKSEDFFPFSENSHDNAMFNDSALFHKPITKEKYLSSKIIHAPNMKIYDAAPICNGAAAILLSSEPPPSLSPSSSSPPSRSVYIAGSGAATDNITLRAREDPLNPVALERSAKLALADASMKLSDMDILELHDAYSVMAALALESLGVVGKGEATAYAKEGEIRRGGKTPISIFGGLKARGHPVGASGMYQACEVAEAIRDGLPTELGPNAPTKKIDAGLVQSIGGAATSVFAHVLCGE